MILLYTGATANNAPQVNAEKSLGGYVSSTGIPNGRLNNLFSGISKSDVLQKRSVIRMIAISNTSGAKTGVKIYTNTAGKKVKLKLAAAAPALDGNNNPVFESVLDGSSLPYQAELNYHEGEVSAIDIGDLAANAVIGIWILREVDADSFPELKTDKTGKELADLLEAAANSAADETIELVVSYD